MLTETEYAEFARSQLGTADAVQPFPEQTLAWLDGRVPGSMIRFLASVGLGPWRGGFFQTLDPLRYRGLIEAALRGDPDFDPDRTVAFAMSGFGELMGWNRDHRVVHFGLFPNSFSCPEFFSPSSFDIDLAALTPFATLFDNICDLVDSKGKPMFARLKKAHGPLPHGHVFAPRLHPALGGEEEVENFRPVPAVEAIALMHQAEPFVLIDTSTPAMRRVRTLGPQG